MISARRQIHRVQRGFSLLELMVVMFMIGMLIGLVAINGFQFAPDSELQDYAEDIYEQLRFGSDEALFGGEHIGLVPQLEAGEDDVERWQLVWHRWREGNWQPLETLAAIQPPKFVQMSVEIDEEPVDLYQWLDFEKAVPVLTFFGGGEALAGTLILSLDRDAAVDVQELERRYVHMDITEIGRVVWRERAAAEQQLFGDAR